MATQSDTDINWDHETKTRSGWDQDEIRMKSSETNCWAQLAIAFHIVWNMCIHTYIHTCTHTYMYTYIHVHIHTYIHTCTHTYIHTCTYIHTYMYTYSTSI
jgi:hypothetical protein